MNNISFVPPTRTMPRPSQDLAFAPIMFDATGAPLSEAEVTELAVRLIDARNEAEFDHVLGIILTHAAKRAGSLLPAEAGCALGGLLKSIAQRGLTMPEPTRLLGLELEGLEGYERVFEAALRFVRLAAEASRHAVEDPILAPHHLVPPHLAARASLAAAAGIYAPPLLLVLAPQMRGSGSGVRRHAALKTIDRLRTPSQMHQTAVWVEPFDYDPEMEYFIDFGGLGRSISHAVSGVGHAISNFKPIKDIGNAARSVVKTVGDVGDAIGKVPILGDVTRGIVGAARTGLGPVGFAIDAGVRLANGEDLGRALKDAANGSISAVRDQLKLAQMVAPFVPGLGQGVAAALGAANALASGQPITEALLAAARSAVPGGAVAQAAFDVAMNLAKGKNIGEAALDAARNQLPGGPAARAAFDAATALAQGKKIQDVAIATAGKLLPPSPYAEDAVNFVKKVANGQNIGHAALSVAGQHVLRQVNANGILAAAAPKQAWRGFPTSTRTAFGTASRLASGKRPQGAVFVATGAPGNRRGTQYLRQSRPNASA